MKVTQFFLFMGPRIWSFRRGEVEYGIRSLPVGAFVRIIGMHNLDPPSAEEADRAYMNKSYPKRMLVITAGSIMHFIQALLLFTIITSVIGLDNPARWSISEISRLTTGETPAVEAGLDPGDTIVAINGVEGLDWGDLRDYIRERPNEEVVLTVVEPDGTTEDRITTLASIPDTSADDPTAQVGFLGVTPSFETTRESPLMAVEMFGEVFWAALSYIPVLLNPETYLNLAQLMASGSAEVSLTDEEAERPISMVGAVRIAGDPDFDITWPISLLAMLNIFVGLLNLLPLLPLDGGHAAIATYEAVRSKVQGRRHHADVAKLLPLTYGVVAVLGFIFISTVWLDIFRPITT
jgi:membrane-associated protease RseP (regulator of RpoE activity)